MAERTSFCVGKRSANRTPIEGENWRKKKCPQKLTNMLLGGTSARSEEERGGWRVAPMSRVEAMIVVVEPPAERGTRKIQKGGAKPTHALAPARAPL